MEQERYATSMAGTGTRLAAPALRARRQSGGGRPVRDEADRDGTRNIPAPRAANADENGLWPRSADDPAEAGWADYLPILRSGAIIGAMGAMGFSLVLYTSQPGLMKRVDRAIQAELALLPDAAPATAATPAAGAPVQMAAKAPEPAPQTEAAPAPPAAPPVQEAAANPQAAPVREAARQPDPQPALAAADAAPVQPTAAPPRVSQAMAAAPLSAPRLRPHRAAMLVALPRVPTIEPPATELRAAAPMTANRPRQMALAETRTRPHPQHPADPAKMALPGWLTHPRPVVLVMSEKPHNLVPAEAMRAQPSPPAEHAAPVPARPAYAAQTPAGSTMARQADASSAPPQSFPPLRQRSAPRYAAAGWYGGPPPYAPPSYNGYYGRPYSPPPPPPGYGYGYQ